ncbi:MAG: hypothetical protein HYZ69_01000 [Candidatus Colwellbacteria bacterium]|nr:hypothetical protein [Candidatus Colwellbacteria bacterium]
MADLIKLPFASRVPDEPIIQPRQEGKYWWEKNGVFNPAAAEYGGFIFLLYRAYDTSYVSRLGLATSEDGVHFTEYDHPVVDTDPDDPYERMGIEDPRITKIEDTYYILHTSASYSRISDYMQGTGIGEDTPWRVRIGMHTTKDFKSYTHHGVILPDISAKNGVLLPKKINNKFCLLYREWIGLESIVKMSLTEDFKTWEYIKEISLPAKSHTWMGFKWGLGSQPIETAKGYLTIYHGVDNDRVYRLGLLMLDKKDPSEVLWYSTPILEPVMPYEKAGFVPNVVYSCGALIKNKDLWIYYGGADRVIGRAVLDVSAFV